MLSSNNVSLLLGVTTQLDRRSYSLSNCWIWDKLAGQCFSTATNLLSCRSGWNNRKLEILSRLGEVCWPDVEPKIIIFQQPNLALVTLNIWWIVTEAHMGQPDPGLFVQTAVHCQKFLWVLFSQFLAHIEFLSMSPTSFTYSMYSRPCKGPRATCSS